MTADFAVATLSHTGRRARNEDRFGEAAARDGSRRAWVVADGVGGQPGGAAAAEAAVRAALAFVERSAGGEPLGDTVRGSLEAAQAAVAALRERGGANAAMATTIALAVSDGTAVAWGHVGDSRIYRVRGGALERLTRDHSVSEALRGLAGRADDDDDRPPEHGSALLSALGAPEPSYEVSAADALRPGEAFLLCTDGLWAQLAPAAIAAALRGAASLQDWLDRLGRCVEDANDSGQDNYTAVAFRPPAAGA